MKQVIDEQVLLKDKEFSNFKTFFEEKEKGILSLARDLTFVLAAHGEDLGEVSTDYTQTVTSNLGIKRYFSLLVYWRDNYGYDIALELPEDEIGIDATKYHWYREL